MTPNKLAPLSVERGSYSLKNTQMILGLRITETPLMAYFLIFVWGKEYLEVQAYCKNLENVCN